MQSPIFRRCATGRTRKQRDNTPLRFSPRRGRSSFRKGRLRRRRPSTLLSLIGSQPGLAIDLGAVWVERSDALRLDTRIAPEKSDSVFHRVQSGGLLLVLLLGACTPLPSYSRLPVVQHPSVNFNERRPSFIILHHTGRSDTERALATLSDRGTDV